MTLHTFIQYASPRFSPATNAFTDALVERTAEYTPGKVDIVTLGLAQYDSPDILKVVEWELTELFDGPESIFEETIDTLFNEVYERPWFFGIAVPTLMQLPNLPQRTSLCYATMERMAVKVGRFPSKLDADNCLRITGPITTLDHELPVILPFITALRKHVVHQG